MRHLLLVCLLLSTARADDDRGLVRVKDMTTETRTALVIGNSSYKVGALRNPKNDAQLIAATLEAVGFKVTKLIDADQKRMKRAIQDLGAPSNGGVGLFYYAGHALQVNGKNYLVPVDASIRTQADVEIESVDVAAVLGKMNDAGNRMNIVVLDACRNNPFARSFRSTSMGLAFTDAPQGTLIAYATAPGDVAADGDGGNSPYTESLARQIRVRGLEIGQMFRTVRSDVRKHTAEKQTPWESSSLEGQFYFVLPDRVDAPPTAAIPPPDPARAAATSTEHGGPVRISTNMPGASLTIDGADAGIVPTTIDSLPVGLRRIHLRKGPFVGSSELVVERGRPAELAVPMSLNVQFEIGLDGMYGFLIDDFFLGRVGGRLKIRESGNGRHWLQIGAGYGLFGSNRSGDVSGGVSFDVLQTFRVPLAGADKLTSRALDLAAGPQLGVQLDTGTTEVGGMFRADLVIDYFTAGIWGVFGGETLLNAGLSIGIRAPL